MTPFQRRADEHAKRHARDVARALAETDRTYGFDRLLLAGGPSDLEREEEAELVEHIVGASAANGRAVTGLQSTVRALGEGRIRQLVISNSFSPHWEQLDEPAAWLHERPNDSSDDLLERLVNQTSGTGGRIEVVWGAAAERLEESARPCVIEAR